jgi:ribosomal protein S18 acetylase RimI-like enzyme
MATSTPTAGDPFPRSPCSFDDDACRRITIEASGHADEELLAMYADFADEERSQGLPPRDEDRIRDWVHGLFDDGVNVVARHRDSVVGHAVLLPFDGKAELAIFVHHDYQEAGIESRLIRVLLGQATGIERVWLAVARSNAVAVSLYRSVGFETVSSGLELEMELGLGAAETGES